MSTQQSGLVAGNKQNEAGGATGKSRSRFPLSYSFISTERFAEYTPFYVQEGVSGDRLPLNSNHELQTYNLKSPVIQSLVKKKDFFAVPMQAILPLNWEKFYENPNIGEDVPDNVGLGVENFWQQIAAHFMSDFESLKLFIADTGQPAAVRITNVFKSLLFYEKFYSCGSLLEYLGISGHAYCRILYQDEHGFADHTYDEMFDNFMAGVASILTSSSRYIQFTLDGIDYRISSGADGRPADNVVYVTLRESLELLRDDLTFSSLSFGIEQDADTIVTAWIALFNQYTLDMPSCAGVPLNLGRLWAYQLVCAHFFSNDHVDFIYSADLFRQYIWQLFTNFAIGFQGEEWSFVNFSVNGLSYQYDALSAFVCSYFLNDDHWDFNNDFLAYWTALFSFKRSLRFMDYFTGSRTYPLAVGDSTVEVKNNAVNIVDLSRSSMMTKFLQAVNRSGRKFGAYMQELFGITPKYDYHNPLYLAHVSDVVGASETENTADAQVSERIAVTSRLRATSSRYAFEFEPDRDCIVIGLSYYDLPRVYSRATERQNFAVDRFDYFNPYLQFIGDQPIYTAEIGTDDPKLEPFSYTNRDMHYKQRYNQCAGGFCVPSTGLDHWIFIADELRRSSFHHISPSFIRSFNSEIDKFYQGLTGYSLGTYFHFIVRYDNRMNASRPMAFNPALNV